MKLAKIDIPDLVSNASEGSNATMVSFEPTTEGALYVHSITKHEIFPLELNLDPIRTDISRLCDLYCAHSDEKSGGLVIFSN